MRQCIVIFILQLLIIVTVFAQNVDSEGSKTSKVSTNYNRNAVTVVVLNNGTQFIDELKKASTGIVIPSKYDDNLVGTRYINGSPSVKSIEKALRQQKLPNEILGKWFSRQKSGQFDMSVVHDRGMYNASDDDVNMASGSKIGLAQLKDAGEILINHSYILVLEFNNILSLNEKYDKEDAENMIIAKKLGTKFEPVKRRKNGWEGEVKGYVYRMSFNDSVMNFFYNDLWINENDDEPTKLAKKQKFDNTEFPISFVISAAGMADGSQYNAGEFLAPPTQLSKDELFQRMINSGMSAIFFDVDRKVEEFRVKTPLYGTNPLRAKVGKKEGLYADQRYFVYEFQQKRNGETKANRKGVVRAKKVVDNRTVATGNSKLYTTFYQTAGFGLSEGMFLQQRNDFGIGVSSGYVLLGQMGGVNVKIESNLGVLFGILTGQDFRMNQIKLYGSAGFQTKEYTLNTAPNLVGITDDFSFTRLNAGLSKGWYFANNFSFAAFIGYGIESGTSENWRKANFGDDDDGTQSISTALIHYGAYGTLNILHNLQIVGTLNMYSLIGAAMDKDSKEINGSMYNDIFKDRSGLSLELGLRLEF